MFRSLSRGRLAFDLLVPTVLFLFAQLIQLLDGSGGIVRSGVVLGMCLSLVFWRANAGLALGVAWATAIAQLLLQQTPDVSNLAIFVVLYATTAHGSRVVKWLGFVSTFVGAALIAADLVVAPAVVGGYLTRDELIRSTLIAFFSFLALFLLAWTLGLLAKTFSGARESRLAQTAAEADKERARYAVTVEQERTRIARDMHDVVAHSLAVVIAQADGARYAREADPAAVDDALTTIATTAREALGDVRVLLAQLRHSQVEGPQPALDDLERLVDQMRSTGLDIAFSITGESGPLGKSQQLAVYRIVQEAMTNSLRHGDRRSPVRVVLRWLSETVEATVANSAPDTTSFIPGHGLAGMRERAALVGGQLNVEVSEGRFSVSVSVPRVGGQTGPVFDLTTAHDRSGTLANLRPPVSPTVTPTP